jgi:ribosomal protein S25
MGKLATNEELKQAWQKEKVARRHEDAAEVMYDALQQIRKWFGSHVIVTSEDMAQASEYVDRIAKAALDKADGGQRPSCFVVEPVL